jgi:hypothetical protein
LILDTNYPLLKSVGCLIKEVYTHTLFKRNSQEMEFAVRKLRDRKIYANAEFTPLQC